MPIKRYRITLPLAAVIFFATLLLPQLEHKENACWFTSAMPEPIEAPAESVEDTLRREFKDTPVMIDIAWCESQFHQFESDGSVRRGRINSQDVGVMQINEFYHLEASKKLGFDIYTLQGNIDYAKHLYGQSGTAPWNWSKGCWGK